MTSTPETRGSTAPLASVEPASSGVSSSGAILRLRAVTKSFGPVEALRHVDLEIPAGQVTALIGDNGAGKSTLIKTIAGIYAPTSGDIFWKGEKVSIHTPRDAEALGIATVYQDLALCDNLDIVQNMFLGHENTKHGLLDEIEMELKTKQVLSELSVTTIKSTRQLVGSLSGGQRQSIAVARAVMHESELVIMDEPTAALGVSQTAQVLGLIKRLASRNIAVLVISHNLNDVFAVADRVAVMHLGTLVSAGPIKDYDTTSAVELITTGERTKTSLTSPA